MENEKLKILKMLEDRKISATEAAELLKAVDGSGSPPPAQQSGSTFTSHQTGHYHSPPPDSTRYTSYTPNTGRPESGGSSFNINMEDLGRKFESFAKDMAPKVQKFTEVMADKIAGAADKVSDVFSVDHRESMPTAPTQSYTSRPTAPTSRPSAPSGVQQINTELLVEKGGLNELDLSGLAGEIRIKGYNGDKITAGISYKTSRHGSPIELVRLGSKYFLKYEADDFSSVSIDAYVPDKAFSVVKIEGLNCEVDVSSLTSGQIRISNMNGSVSLSGLSASNIFAESSGGRFNVSNIICDGAKFENLNGPLEASELDISELKLSNYNAQLSLMLSKFERHTNYIWSIETGNAKLNINLPALHDTGYHIKAHAAMSEIRLGLTGLQFLVHEPSLVEARSVNFDRCVKKVKMAVETSNAPLVIN